MSGELGESWEVLGFQPQAEYREPQICVGCGAAKSLSRLQRGAQLCRGCAESVVRDFRQRALFEPPLDLGEDLYCSLHTSNPAGGTQETFEVSYRGYRRVAIARQLGSWEFRDGGFWNTMWIEFARVIEGSCSVFYFGVGSSPENQGTLIECVALTPSIYLQTGVLPYFAPGSICLSSRR